MSSVLHIGIILDGNRRYAQQENKLQLEGHTLGAQNVQRLIMEWAPQFGITELTLYAFSMQNFNRSREEINYLMQLFLKFFTLLSSSKEFASKNIKVRFLGRISLFPQSVVDSMQMLMDTTKKNSGLTVNFCMAYGGREEIVDATRAIAVDVLNGKLNVDDIGVDTLHSYMYLQSEPDLIIRTGGEQRTSNFLMWQSWYSEWFFINTFWPEFTLDDLKSILCEFKNRKRRFGT